MPDNILGNNQSNKKNNPTETIDEFDKIANKNINKRRRNVDSDSNESNTSSVKRRKSFQDKISSIIYNKDMIPESTSDISTPMDCQSPNSRKADKENYYNQEKFEHKLSQESKHDDTNDEVLQEEEEDQPLQKKLSVVSKTYQCDMCDKICKNERALDKHLENKHSSTTTSKKVSSEECHKCQKCDKIFTNGKKLMDHICVHKEKIMEKSKPQDDESAQEISDDDDIEIVDLNSSNENIGKKHA